MTRILTADAEALVIQLLDADTDVTAATSGRVYAAMPAGEPDFPMVLVWRIGGAPVTRRPLYVDRASIQVDVYGGTKAEAHDLAAHCRAALAERRGSVGTVGVLVDARFGPVRFEADPADTGRARYSFDVDITTRPLG